MTILSRRVARVGLAMAIALVFATGCGGSSSDDSDGSTSTTGSASGSSSGNDEAALVAACSEFKTDSADAGLDVDDQIEATETFKTFLVGRSNPTAREAALLTYTEDRLIWLGTYKMSDAATAGKAPVSEEMVACGTVQASDDGDEADDADGCDEFEDTWDSLEAGVKTTPAEAQVEANILLAKNPPADVVTAIGVLVTAADGLSGAELSLDREGAAETVDTWAESVC